MCTRTGEARQRIISWRLVEEVNLQVEWCLGRAQDSSLPGARREQLYTSSVRIMNRLLKL